IIHSSSFRRLQGKTQIFGLGESDFYRTRLTHSMEVAQISSGIIDVLVTNNKDIDFFPNQNLIETIGLAHDIGHPPFGHGGEKALNYCLSKKDNVFEGNAQTYRICTYLGEHSSDNGFNLTRRCLLGLIKYPISFEDAINPKSYDYDKAPTNLDSFKPPKCIYEFDRTFHWIMEPFSKEDNKKFCESVVMTNKHHKSKYKSFDCSVMELADDISYGIHDLEDAIALGFINKGIWEKQVIDKMDEEYTDLKDIIKKKQYIEDLFSGQSFRRKRVISHLIHYFIKNVQLNKQSVFKHSLLDYQAILIKHIKKELDIFQNLVCEYVIKKQNVQMLEYCGEMLIIKLFEAIYANPKRFLPDDYFQLYEKNQNNIRIVSDYIAGMTDNHAVHIYHQIFSPDEGSMFRKI
ncbi:MAG: anti-phage deoxyguanosine triphosphatase, partial [Bacteroidia bacterium]